MTVPIVPIEDRSVRRRGQLFVALAALAWSSAGVLQRELSVGTTTQLAGRALFAFAALSAFVAVSNRDRTIVAFPNGVTTRGSKRFASMPSVRRSQ